MREQGPSERTRTGIQAVQLFPLLLILANRHFALSQELSAQAIPAVFCYFPPPILLLIPHCLLDIKLGRRSQREEIRNDSVPAPVFQLWSLGDGWKQMDSEGQGMGTCVFKPALHTNLGIPYAQAKHTLCPGKAPLSLCWQNLKVPIPRSPLLWLPCHLDEIPYILQPRLAWHWR